MCTLVVLHRAVPGVPLLAAANRDEFFDRRAEGPALRRTPGGVVIVAPRDARGGGTWLGVSARGVFAALTNVAGAERDATRRSRGLLVLEALESGSAREAAERVEGMAPGVFNPFNLVVADVREAFVFGEGGGRRALRLAPGAHVVGNQPLAAPPTPKLARLRDRVRGIARRPLESAVAELAELCREHRVGDPLGSACVHTESYGTRSSTLLALADPGPGLLRFAEGAPCRTEYRDFTPLLDELVQGTRGVAGESVTRKIH